MYLNPLERVCLNLAFSTRGAFGASKWLGLRMMVGGFIVPTEPLNFLWATCTTRMDTKRKSIPDYQTLMLPVLKLAEATEVVIIREAVEALAVQFKLTDADRKHRLPSGSQATFNNRVGWAKTYLVKAGLLESHQRGRFNITDRGRSVLSAAPPHIDNKYLRKFKEFNDFRKRKNAKQKAGAKPQTNELIDNLQTPGETMEAAYDSLRDELKTELLSVVLDTGPTFFEQLVVDLLVRMGYGGTRRDAGQAIGQSNDGGIGRRACQPDV